MYPATHIFLDRESPDPKRIEQMWAYLKKSRELAEARLKGNPNDVEAHYALGMAYAVETNYHANVTEAAFAALRSGTRAKNHHQRVLQFAPSNHDAKLLLGLYEYAVGSLPPALRFLVFFIGHTGSIQRGIELMQDALVNGKRSRPAALSLLTLAYTRERNHAQARAMLERLLEMFPRNYFFEMEIAATFLRENNPAAALDTYRRIEQKKLQGVPGYERVSAERLPFEIASTLEMERRSDEAIQVYMAIASNEGNSSRLRGLSYIHLGSVYRNTGRPVEAEQMFESAKQFGWGAIKPSRDRRR